MRLSIIVPAYNEEDRLPTMLDAYAPHVEARYGAEAEILVVVNGSRDRTAEVAGRYAGAGRAVRVLVEPNAVGKGGAVMLGMAEARGELIGFVDADGATPPEAFEELVRQRGDAGAVIASRWLRGARVSPPQPLDRRVASRIFNALVRFLFRLRITDTQCGAKLLTREAVRTVLPRLGITQWAFDVDLLFQLRRAGFRIREIPTEWHDRAGSRVRVVRASAQMLAALARLRLLYSPLRWVVALYDATLGRIVKVHGTVERD